MNMIIKAALLAAAPIAAAVALPNVVMAQAVSNVAVADLEDATHKSNAFVLAINQIKITYKAQIDALELRQRSLNAELQPLALAIQNLQKAPVPNQTLIQTQYTAFQAKQASANKELQTLGAPVSRAQAYAEEQIVAKLDAALKAAMVAKRVTLVISPQAAISYQPGTDITADIVTQINALITTVSITPPAGWQPGQAQQAPAAPAAAAPATAAPATPAAPRPTGR